MTPEQLAKSGSEDALQMALFARINEWSLANKGSNTSSHIVRQLRWVHAIPNGGHRHKAVAGTMKATGAKPGVWDIFVPVPVTTWKAGYGGNVTSHGLYVEMKTPDRRNHKNGGLSDPQVEFRDFVAEHGYAHVVCYGYEEAFNAILKYLGVAL